MHHLLELIFIGLSSTNQSVNARKNELRGLHICCIYPTGTSLHQSHLTPLSPRQTHLCFKGEIGLQVYLGGAPVVIDV